MSLAPSYWDRFLRHTLDRIIVLNDSDPQKIQVAISRRHVNVYWENQPAEWTPCVISQDSILTYDQVFDHLNERQDSIERRYFQEMAALSSSRDRIDELFAR